jgi:hypothetical protein
MISIFAYRMVMLLCVVSCLFSHCKAFLHFITTIPASLALPVSIETARQQDGQQGLVGQKECLVFRCSLWLLKAERLDRGMLKESTSCSGALRRAIENPALEARNIFGQTQMLIPTSLGLGPDPDPGPGPGPGNTRPPRTSWK